MHKPEWYFKGYGLNQKETRSLKKFLKAHKDCENGFTDITQSNGIGTNLFILCHGCKRWEDVCDVGCW